ncbi:MAG: TolC family protein [Kiritimatiellae bacterium]|nr:TolC family protein [Kiritimatiellia bacterium]
MYWRMLQVALAAGALAGCRNPDAAYREEAAQAFKTNLVAETERVLAEAGGVLTLSNALELAHARSLKLARQDLEAKLARINRATAFSAFLPTVGLSGMGLVADGGVYDLPYLGDLKENRLRAGAGSLVVAQPVFTPVAWVMFAESQYGVRIKDIVRERAGQLLDVQVAALFYQTAVAERRVETAGRQLESSRALTNRVMRLVSEGYATPADAARAKARCVLAETSLASARDDAAAAREELAGLLHLWPLATFRVSGESLLALPPLPEKRVEEWVWEGLVSRQDLAAATRRWNCAKPR